MFYYEASSVVVYIINSGCLFGILFSSLPRDILCLLLSVCILDSYLFVVNLSNAKRITVILEKCLVKATCFIINISEVSYLEKFSGTTICFKIDISLVPYQFFFRN